MYVCLIIVRKVVGVKGGRWPCPFVELMIVIMKAEERLRSNMVGLRVLTDRY